MNKLMPLLCFNMVTSWFILCMKYVSTFYSFTDKEDSIPPPKNWAKVPTGEPYISVPLDMSTTEYKKIAASFQKSVVRNVKIHEVS